MQDWIPAPNIGRHPDVYELENEAIARDGRLDGALRDVADWCGRRLLDIGCGTGFWLPRYAQDAASVIGVEPDPALLLAAQARVAQLSNISVRSGSAEQLPVPDGSVDVVHARFAYFFGQGAEKGLGEVGRVLAPGGVFVAVDNSWRGGEFADLLRDAVGGNADHDPDAIAAWWAGQGAERIEVDGGWQASNAEELRRILRIEFASETVDRFERRHDRADLTYQYALYVLRP